MGQFLSTRLDVLPREITDELQGLQDEVQPESFDDIRRELETELGRPLSEIFMNFDQNPLASASIGQVHRACIRQQSEGAECSGDYPAVVVKIQRPNIENIVETDLAALRIVSRWINYYAPIRKRANVPALLKNLISLFMKRWIIFWKVSMQRLLPEILKTEAMLSYQKCSGISPRAG